MTSIGLVAAAATVGEAVVAGVGVRRPGVEGAGAARKPVVVPEKVVRVSHIHRSQLQPTMSESSLVLPSWLD
jgi:hypothetical protein